MTKWSATRLIATDARLRNYIPMAIRAERHHQTEPTHSCACGRGPCHYLLCVPCWQEVWLTSAPHG